MSEVMTRWETPEQVIEAVKVYADEMWKLATANKDNCCQRARACALDMLVGHLEHQQGMTRKDRADHGAADT